MSLISLIIVRVIFGVGLGVLIKPKLLRFYNNWEVGVFRSLNTLLFIRFKEASLKPSKTIYWLSEIRHF